MRQVFAAELGQVLVRDAEVPVPGPGEALVRTTLVGICGSDTHALAGHHPLLYPPYVPGHEAIGVVEALGEGVDSPALGTRVLLKPNLPCGDCENCRSERSNCCQTLAWVGCDPSGAHPGAMADLFLAPARNLYPLPEQVSDQQAALVECLATPVHAARMAGDLTGRRVVVMGAGTIGVLMLVAARMAGAQTLVVTDLEPAKRDRAVQLGADAAVDAASTSFADDVVAALGGKAEVVFDCVAVEASARQWTSIVRRGATICIVGVPNRDFTVPMPLIQDWELRVQGCAAYTEVDVEQAIRIGAEIPADLIICEVRPLEDAAAAFEQASRSTSGKVLLAPGGGQ